MAKSTIPPRLELKQDKPTLGLKNYKTPTPPPRNALAQQLAAEYNAKQMLVPTTNKLADETGSRPAPAFNLGRFDPKILSGSRQNYENWRMNALAPKTEFGGVYTPMFPRA